MNKYISWLKIFTIITCLLPVFTFADADASLGSNSSAATGQKQYLFVLLSKQGAIQEQKNQPGNYQLTLKGANPAVIYFTNRPQRYSGKIALDKFLQQWQTGSFKNNPPNAVIEAVRLIEHFAITHKKSVSYTVELFNPQYNAKKDLLTFDIRSLPGSGGDKLPNMGHSDYVAMFIDNVNDVCPGCM